MKTFRITLWVAIAVLGGFLAWSTFDWNQRADETGKVAVGPANVGGPFTALRADGTAINRKAMLGRPHAVFFGFTHCPDVCPTTLYEAGLWLSELGADGDKLDVYFVTVDPERDPPEVLAQYLSAFDKRIIGITGTPEQIVGMTGAWKAFAKKEPTDDGYTMNHTASVFLTKANGDFQGTIAFGEDADTAVKKLRRLVDG